MKTVVLTGAGISAESGIKTFRDADGLWEGHDVMEVASPKGWEQNMELVLDFYNQRRAQLHVVKPNLGHLAVKSLENTFDVVVVTQNVDDLHERAGSSKIIHLHGELRKMRSVNDSGYIVPIMDDITMETKDQNGHQMRPHIVWFGESVPKFEEAVAEMQDADIVIIIGTSMQVYPAAGLVAAAPEHAEVYYVDPAPHINYELRQRNHLQIIEDTAANGLPALIKRLTEKYAEK